MLITLTTDFGVSSPYVAAIKGSLLSVCPTALLVDLTHAIAPQNVREAAVVLADVTPIYPAGTLHVVVVDPGVGTKRKLIYAEISDQRYLAPDNGVLSYLGKQVPPRRIIELSERQFWRQDVSNTFHGRDIFAPVAGHLASGTSPDFLGEDASQLHTLTWPEPQFTAEEVIGEALYIDSFGNIITNIPIRDLKAWTAGRLLITVNSHTISGIQATYGCGQSGELVALGDSQGRLEVAIVNGNAARALNAQPGNPVRIRRE